MNQLLKSLKPPVVPPPHQVVQPNWGQLRTRGGSPSRTQHVAPSTTSRPHFLSDLFPTVDLLLHPPTQTNLFNFLKIQNYYHSLKLNTHCGFIFFIFLFIKFPMLYISISVTYYSSMYIFSSFLSNQTEKRKP